MTTSEGPAMTQLHHRMTSTPEVVINGDLPLHLTPLVHDLVFSYSSQFLPNQLDPFRKTLAQCPWHIASYLMLYFLADPAFKACNFSSEALLISLQNTAQELFDAGNNRVYVEDVDKREEFIRVVLASLKLRPEGETQAQADDRLLTVSSLERKRIMQASRVAEERAERIRKQMAAKAARQAADKLSRE